jgi:site-specific recombinase XerD
MQSLPWSAPGTPSIIARSATASKGLEDHVTSHRLRHSFGVELTRSGVDLVTVAELMGHASLETTRLYTRPSAADMQRAVDLLFADD